MNKKILFLKLFSKNLILSLSVLLIVFSAVSANKNLFKQGPEGVFADDGNSEYVGSQDWESPVDGNPDYGSSEAVYSAPMDYTQDYGNSEYVSSQPLYDYGNSEFVSSVPLGDYGNSEFVSSEPLYQPQPQPVQAQAPINYPMRPGSYNVTSTGPVYNPPVYNPPIYQTRSTPQNTGSVYNPVTYTYTYDSHNSVDSHNRSTSTVDSHNRTRIDDHSISGSFNDQRRNDQSQTLTVSAPQGGVAAGQSMGSNYLYTAPNTTLSYPYPFANPAYMAPMTQQVVTYPMRPAPQYQHPQMATYAVSNPYPVYTTQAAPVYASQPVYVQDPNISKTVIVDTQPKVVTVAATDASNLPKTGLPLAGLGLGALLPIGLKMRKIGRLNFSESYITPNSLWQERQSQLTI